MKQTLCRKLLTTGTLLCMLPPLLSAENTNTQLNISPAIQTNLERMLKYMKTLFDADEIIAGVMESKTGKVLALASSNPYDLHKIMHKEMPPLKQKFSAYPYEPGSVMNPITLALALDSEVVTPNTRFNTYNGEMTIGEGQWITDDDKFESLTATDIIVHSSNIGISEISWKLTGKKFREGLVKFGFSKQSGIDLASDSPGDIKALHFLDNKMHRANTSFGYGMQTTFTQLLKAYSVFNNAGVMVTPKLTMSNNKDVKQVVSKKTANQIHDILKDVVKRGFGVKAQYEGLEIGGKTGTAHIAKNGRYVREYHSSFYGFANDKMGNKYTIGVLVIRAKKKYKYFASQSAVPTFKNVVEILVEDKKLYPNAEIAKKMLEIDMSGVTPRTSPM